MEAIMVAGIAVVAVGGWYSMLDLLAGMGIRFKKPGRVSVRSLALTDRFAAQRRIKQMAGMNI